MALETPLPQQLFVNRIIYKNDFVDAVDMMTPEGDAYRFWQRPEYGQYAVLRLRERDDGVSEIAENINPNQAPSVLERIFLARTRSAIGELQARRLLIDTEHTNR